MLSTEALIIILFIIVIWVLVETHDSPEKGWRGRRGFTGKPGEPGEPGADGASGADGTDGAQGPQGVGVTGSGEQGPQGPTGPQAPPGGPQGAQGSGAQGATGQQGTTGPQGSQGAGAQGSQGIVGIQGGQGVQGSGPQGAAGVQGLVGVQGAQGAQGVQGSGPQGAQGLQAALGVQGAQGAQGVQGSGPQGAQGIQAAAGIQGAQGIQGSGPGVQGPQGVQGTQGIQGVQGTALFEVVAVGVTSGATLTLDTEQTGLSPYVASAISGNYFQLWGHVPYAGATGPTGLAQLSDYPEITITKTGEELGFPPGVDVAEESTSGIWSTCLRYNPVSGPTGTGMTAAGLGQNFNGAVLLRYNTTTDVVTFIFRNCYRFEEALTLNSFLEPLTFILSGQFVPLDVAPLTIESTFASVGIFNPAPATNFIPPDPTAAVGPSVVVIMVNSAIAIYDKVTGTQLFIQGLSPVGGFFDSTGAVGSAIFDPWVVYDHHVGRFVAMAVQVTNTGSALTSTSHIYLAVSTTANPLTGTDWYKYRIDRTATSLVNADVTFPDYPKLGYDDKAYYITANNFGIVTGVFSNVSMFAINKIQVISGGPVEILFDAQFTGGQFSIHPMEVYDAPSQAMYFASVASATQIRIYALENILTTPTVSTSLVTVNTFGNPGTIPQPGSPGVPNLHPVDARIMSGCVRNQQLWTAHAVTDAAVSPGRASLARWYQFNVAPFPPSAPTLVQQQSIPPVATDSLWMTYINVDKENNMGIGFSVCGTAAGRFASIGYTGRRSTDALNTTLPYLTATAGLDNYQRLDGFGRNRWGDYSGLAMDPDGRRFWMYNEYAGISFAAGSNGGNWLTQVSTFSVPDTHMTPLFAPNPSSRASVVGVIEVLRSKKPPVLPSSLVTPTPLHVARLD